MTIARIAAPTEQAFQEHQTKAGVVDQKSMTEWEVEKRMSLMLR